MGFLNPETPANFITVSDGGDLPGSHTMETQHEHVTHIPIDAEGGQIYYDNFCFEIRPRSRNFS